MKLLRLTLIFLTTSILFFDGRKLSGQEMDQKKEIVSDSKYVSIVGLWKCTPETAVHFGSITVNATIKIDYFVPDKWGIQGVFLWEGQVREYWPLSGFQFNDTTNKITFRDIDGSFYIGTVDKKKQKITGMMYSGDPGNLIPEDKLDFVRAAGIDPNRLFTPRIPEKDGSIQYIYRVPLTNGFLIGESIYKHAKDSTLLYDLLEQIILQKFGRVESFLIAKDHKLVLEEYFFKYDNTQVHNTFSCTKSVVSLLTGIALYEHDKMDVDQSVFDFFPDLEDLKTEAKEKIKLKHVLTMTAGLQPLEDSYSIESQELLIRDILSQPQDSRPGSTFRYNSECPYLLGGIINKLEGKQVEEYACEKLFDPLGITDYKWNKHNGVTECQSNLYLLPRDMLKIGMMVLNDGEWQGKQIVPEEWIRESSKYRVAESEYFNYAYQWWHRSAENNSWWEYPKTIKEHDILIALGFGGQYIFIVRDFNLVIVITSSDYNEGNGMSFKKIPMVIEHVIPLFEN